MTFVRRVVVGSRALLLCAALAISPLAVPAPTTWYEGNSAGVDIVSTLPEAGTAQVVQAVTDYRAALHLLFPALDLTPSPPVTLLIVARPESSGPVFQMCRNCAGSTYRGEAATYILDAASWGGFADGIMGSAIALHELTHKILDQTYRGALPVWLDEGMAELLSTLRRDQSGRLIIGLASQERWAALQYLQWMPLATVLAVGRDSKEYSSHEGAPAFYAESWLLVHYAQLARRERWSQIQAYINLLRQGMNSADALARAFPEGIAALDAELRTYSHQRKFVAATIEVPLTTAPPVQPLSSAEGERRYAAVLVDLLRLRHHAPTDALLHYVQQVADASPNDSEAQLLLALARTLAGKTDQARPLLEQSCAEPLTSADVALLCANTRLAGAEREKDPTAPGAIEAITAARAYCEAALRIAPDDLRAWVSLADTYILAPGDSAAVRARLEQYLAATPSNYRIAKQLAFLYIDVDAARAKRYVDQVLLDAHDPQERAAAERTARLIEQRLAAPPAASADKP